MAIKKMTRPPWHTCIPCYSTLVENRWLRDSISPGTELFCLFFKLVDFVSTIILITLPCGDRTMSCVPWGTGLWPHRGKKCKALSTTVAEQEINSTNKTMSLFFMSQFPSMTNSQVSCSYSCSQRVPQQKDYVLPTSCVYFRIPFSYRLLLLGLLKIWVLVWYVLIGFASQKVLSIVEVGSQAPCFKDFQYAIYPLPNKCWASCSSISVGKRNTPTQQSASGGSNLITRLQKRIKKVGFVTPNLLQHLNLLPSLAGI